MRNFKRSLNIVVLSLVLFLGNALFSFENKKDVVYISSAWSNPKFLEDKFKTLLSSGGRSWYNELQSAKIEYKFESFGSIVDYISDNYSFQQKGICGFVARKNGVMFDFADIYRLIAFARADEVKLRRYPRFHPYKIGSDDSMNKKQDLALKHLNSFRANPTEFLDRLEKFYMANPVEEDMEVELLEAEGAYDNENPKPVIPEERIKPLKELRKTIQVKKPLPPLEYNRGLFYTGLDIASDINRKVKLGKDIISMSLKELLTEMDGSKLEDRVARYGKGKVFEIYFSSEYSIEYVSSGDKYKDIKESPFYGFVEKALLNEQASIKDLKEILNPNLKYYSLVCMPMSIRAGGVCVLHLGYKDYRNNSYQDTEETIQ